MNLERSARGEGHMTFSAFIWPSKQLFPVIIFQEFTKHAWLFAAEKATLFCYWEKDVLLV